MIMFSNDVTHSVGEMWGLFVCIIQFSYSQSFSEGNTKSVDGD